MYRVSSNSTIFFKLFLPTFWIVFFGLFTAFTFFYDDSQILLLTLPEFKYGILAFYFIFIILLYFTIIRLKRVEMGPDHYYVSNYLKNYKLIYEDIKEVSQISLGKFTLVKFHLAGKSSLGKSIIFLANSFLYQNFLNSHPEVKEKIELKRNQDAATV